MNFKIEYEHGQVMVTINGKKNYMAFIEFHRPENNFSGRNKIAQMNVAQFCRKLLF